MKNLGLRLPKAFHHPNFPVILILIANIIAGLFTFQDYGLTWDEPLFYQYADAVPYAYSISARLNGDFDIEKAYGPSSEHKLYGPVYLLLAKPVVDMMDWVLPASRPDLWHLVNFLTFQVGVLLFFALCRRWMEPWSAFGATLLFSTQPVLWGHSWINPKDMPFTVLFMAALHYGFKMVDALSDPVSETGSVAPADEDANRKQWRRRKKVIQISALVFTLVTLIGFIFASQVHGQLRELIHSAYQAPSQSMLGRLFGFIATNAQAVPEAAYINKGLVIFSRLRNILVAVSVFFVVPALLLTFRSKEVQRFINWLAKNFGPLPGKPAWWWKKLSAPGVLPKTLLAGILLGMLVSIRVIGPLVGMLVLLYFLFKPKRHSFAGMTVYLVAGILAMVIVWPYLWEAPLANFIKVLQHMSHNPKTLPVLFGGIVLPSDKLPITYLPVMLGITLAWPVWPIFTAGLVASGLRIKTRKLDWRSFIPVALWFFLPFAYVLILRPPMYDGYRHFLFILPPVFIVVGMAFQVIKERLQSTWRYALILVVLIFPGVIGLVRMHPYQYAYYNLLTGGTKGAFRQYETDFWLTCYKELMTKLNPQVSPGTTLFVHRQPSVAREYASQNLLIERFDPDDDRTFPGSLLLLTTRSNVDLLIHPEAPEILSVGHEGAVFCLVKEIP